MGGIPAGVAPSSSAMGSSRLSAGAANCERAKLSRSSPLALAATARHRHAILRQLDETWPTGESISLPQRQHLLGPWRDELNRTDETQGVDTSQRLRALALKHDTTPAQ